MVLVDIHKHGVFITREKTDSEGRQQIFLRRQVWLRLVAIQDEVNDAISGHATDRSWVIGDTAARVQETVTLSEYKGIIYCNIRLWWKNGPTRQGVTLSPTDWLIVQTALGNDEEARLGRRVYYKLMLARFRALTAESCPGCARREREHACKYHDPEAGKLILNEIPRIHTTEFIRCLAEEAHEVGLVIDAPRQTYELCESVFRSSLEAEVLATR